MGQYRYSAFGLSVESPIELSGLSEAIPRSPTDLRVKFGNIPELLNSPLVRKDNFQASSREFLWSPISSCHCRFFIRDGSDIIVEPQRDSIDEIMLAILLAGSVMTAVVAQRGLTPIHAAVLEKDGRAAIIAAKSGLGKSTLAAELWRRGWSLLADDLSVIDTKKKIPHILPGYPRFKLYRDSLEQLDCDPTNLDLVHPTVEKFYLPAETRFQTEAMPLCGMYFLADSYAQSSGVLRLSTRESFRELRAALRFNFSWARLIWPWMFDALVNVANACPASMVLRSSKVCPPSKLADLIETDFCV